MTINTGAAAVLSSYADEVEASLKANQDFEQKLRDELSQDDLQNALERMQSNSHGAEMLKQIEIEKSSIQTMCDDSLARFDEALKNYCEQGGQYAQELSGLSVRDIAATGNVPPGVSQLLKGASAGQMTENDSQSLSTVYDNYNDGNGSVPDNSLFDFLDSVKNDSSLASGDYKEADMLVMSTLAYCSKLCDSPGYRRDSLERGTIGEYCDLILEQLKAERLRLKQFDPNDKNISSSVEEFIVFVEQLRQNGRYKDLVIIGNEAQRNGRVNDHMIVVEYADKNGCIMAFEGTNGTFAGWNSNLEFAMDKISNAQKWAVQQYEEYAKLYKEKGCVIDVGGHSRGGNLAIASVILSDPSLVQNLRHVRSLDGPGFTDSFLKKYAQRIDALEDKIETYIVKNSVVGQMLNSIGKRVFFDIWTNDGYLVSHNSFCWVITEQGDYIKSEEESFSKILHNLTLYLADNLSDESMELLGTVVMNLCRDSKSDSDYNSLISFDGKVIFGNAAEMVLAGDWKMLIDTLVAGAGAIAGIVDYALGNATKYLAAVKVVSGVCMLIPPLAPFGAVVYSAVTVISETVRLVRFICQSVIQICNIYTSIVVNIRKAQRAQYISSNPTIRLDIPRIQNTIVGKINEINNRLDYIDKLFDGIYYQFEPTWEDFVIPFSAVRQLIRSMGIDVHYLRKNMKLKRQGDAMGRVAKYWRDDSIAMASMLSSNGIPVYGIDNQITVTPTALASAASQGSAAIASYKSHFLRATNSVTRLGKNWSADDYTALKNRSQSDEMQMLIDANAAEGYYELVAHIASRYAALQNTSVEEIQNAPK